MKRQVKMVKKTVKKFIALKRFTFTKFGLERVTADEYLSTMGGNPICSLQLRNPGLVLVTEDCVHHGTNWLYLSTSATISYICSIEYLKRYHVCYIYS